MTRFAERFRQEGLETGMEEGMQKGMQKGEALILLRLLQLKFGELPAETRRHIDQANEQMLLQWSERVLSANTLDEVLH
jgi:flagellar biosynthesis/type III secretory pathway protein FliH